MEVVRFLSTFAIMSAGFLQQHSLGAVVGEQVPAPIDEDVAPFGVGAEQCQMDSEPGEPSRQSRHRHAKWELGNGSPRPTWAIDPLSRYSNGVVGWPSIKW